jgi:aryl-alcohol dehydrogenase-like predicted oxidoreductase
VSREIELETLPLCARHGIAVIPWSPLGGGLLSGKYKAAGDLPADSRLGSSGQQAARRMTERNLAVAETVRWVAEETGRTPAQVALNWVLHRPGVTAPLLGARTAEQLEDNLGAAGWQLDPEHADTLDRASRVPLPYPHDMYEFIFGM